MSYTGIQDAMQYTLSQCHCIRQQKDAVKFSVVYCAYVSLIFPKTNMYITNKSEQWSKLYSE